MRICLVCILTFDGFFKPNFQILTPRWLPTAHLALKEAALAKLRPYERKKRTRFQPSDRLLAFLEAL